MEATNEKHYESMIMIPMHENREKVGESGFSFHVVISFLFHVVEMAVA